MAQPPLSREQRQRPIDSGTGGPPGRGGRRPPPARRQGARGAANRSGEGGDGQSRRQEQVRRQAQAREIRWHNNRLAVPYYTDGPKITLGLLWVVAFGVATFLGPLAVALVAAGVAAIAGLQTGAAWFPQHPLTRWWTAGAAFVTGLGGAFGGLGVLAGCGIGLLVLLIYVVTNQVHRRPTGQLVDVLARSALPVGLAAASLAALRDIDLGVVVLLVALVSAYEAGDFLVGSGSSNAVEGPVSGLLALAAVAFVAWILAPAPFTNDSILLFSALAGVCCPLGQITAAGLLPRGSAWAPALRRLDSYLLVAPLWLLLLSSVEGARSL